MDCDRLSDEHYVLSLRPGHQVQQELQHCQSHSTVQHQHHHLHHLFPHPWRQDRRIKNHDPNSNYPKLVSSFSSCCWCSQTHRTHLGQMDLILHHDCHICGDVPIVAISANFDNLHHATQLSHHRQQSLSHPRRRGRDHDRSDDVGSPPRHDSDYDRDDDRGRGRPGPLRSDVYESCCHSDIHQLHHIDCSSANSSMAVLVGRRSTPQPLQTIEIVTFALARVEWHVWGKRATVGLGLRSSYLVSRVWCRVMRDMIGFDHLNMMCQHVTLSNIEDWVSRMFCKHTPPLRRFCWAAILAVWAILHSCLSLCNVLHKICALNSSIQRGSGHRCGHVSAGKTDSQPLIYAAYLLPRRYSDPALSNCHVVWA